MSNQNSRLHDSHSILIAKDKCLYTLFIKTCLFLDIAFKSCFFFKKILIAPGPIEENDALYWYITLRAASSFIHEFGRWPGSSQAYCKKSVDYGKTFGKHPKTDSITDVNLIQSDLDHLRQHSDRIFQSIGIQSKQTICDYMEVSLDNFFVFVCLLKKYFNSTFPDDSQSKLNYTFPELEC